MSTTYTDSDIKVIARHIQTSEGSKYTEALRHATRLAHYCEVGGLEPMWEIRSGQLHVLRQGLNPYDTARWLDFLDMLNEVWGDTFGKWVMARHHHNGYWAFVLVKEGNPTQLATMYVATQNDLDFYTAFNGEQIELHELIGFNISKHGYSAPVKMAFWCPAWPVVHSRPIEGNMEIAKMWVSLMMLNYAAIPETVAKLSADPSLLGISEG